MSPGTEAGRRMHSLMPTPPTTEIEWELACAEADALGLKAPCLACERETVFSDVIVVTPEGGVICGRGNCFLSWAFGGGNDG